MCNGAREHKCWNGVTFDGPLAASKISDAISEAIAELPGFDAEYERLLNEEAQRANESLDDSLKQLVLNLERNDRELANIIAEIKRGSSSLLLREELQRLEAERLRLQETQRCAESDRVGEIVLPSALTS